MMLPMPLSTAQRIISSAPEICFCKEFCKTRITVQVTLPIAFGRQPGGAVDLSFVLCSKFFELQQRAWTCAVPALVLAMMLPMPLSTAQRILSSAPEICFCKEFCKTRITVQVTFPIAFGRRLDLAVDL